MNSKRPAKFNIVVSEQTLDDPRKRDALVREITQQLPSATLDTELLDDVGILGVDCDEDDRDLLSAIDGVESIELEQKRSKRR